MLDKNSHKTKVVTIGGGSGQFVLLSALSKLEGVDITSIVSMADSGGSTGRLRDRMGVLPPGDVLKCLVALSPYRDYARKLLQTRFNLDGPLEGHNAGNMLLSILSQYTGSFPAGVEALGQILDIQGKVLPVTTDQVTLVAEMSGGERLFGEAAIDIPKRGEQKRITDVYLVPHHNDSVRVHLPVLKAIREADYIIVGPGDLFTSIIPNFLVPGVAGAVAKAKAPLIYVVNLMTKFGETDSYSATDFIHKIEYYIERRIDVAVINDKRPSAELIEKYRKEKSAFVYLDKDLEKYLAPRQIVVDDFLEINGIVRHSPDKLAKFLANILEPVLIETSQNS